MVFSVLVAHMGTWTYGHMQPPAGMCTNFNLREKPVRYLFVTHCTESIDMLGLIPACVKSLKSSH